MVWPCTLSFLVMVGISYNDTLSGNGFGAIWNKSMLPLEWHVVSWLPLPREIRSTDNERLCRYWLVVSSILWAQQVGCCSQLTTTFVGIVYDNGYKIGWDIQEPALHFDYLNPSWESTGKTVDDYVLVYTGRWFGTFFMFPYIGKNNPNWLIFFRGVETTN